jgi:hypothetical protein
MIQIKVRTFFDITATGVTGHFKSSKQNFKDQESWNRARNQQRNWETLTQLLNLRTQIMEITAPVNDNNLWSFEFGSEFNVWDTGSDPVGVLKNDSDRVPMLRDLDNNPDIEEFLVIEGPRQNIWFEVVPINTTLENYDG